MKARHARARRSRARSQPVFGAGRVHYEIGARVNAMSYGGIGTMRRLASRLGLVREVNARVKALKRHLPYHESDHVLNIAFNVLRNRGRVVILTGKQTGLRAGHRATQRLL